MANNTSDDLRADLEKQIADLKNEIAMMSESIKGRASEAVDSVENAVDNTKDRARGAARQVRQQAHAVSDAIRENPGTAATVLSSAGLVGFLIGVAVGYVVASDHSNRKHFGWHY